MESMKAVGSQLGPYHLVAPLGAGGMGEVYRGRDARLGRDVAIKILPSGYSQDPDRLRRFEQEARAAGVLNHPNIVSIYDVGTHDGSPYVVTELLEGETLREKLLEGALPVRKAVDYGVQIARGLAAAHERGIVHRDLKPENIFVSSDGRVKILDFGLAKLTEEISETQPGLATTPSETRTLATDTQPGVVLGTIGYMSPEQARGLPLDHRSDIFSLGAILYEMLSGTRAFQGATSADVMTAILKEDPGELSRSSGTIPPAVERIVVHCLEKNRSERFQSARDVAFDLESLSGISGVQPPLPLAIPRRAWVMPAVLSVIAILLAVAIAYVAGRRRGEIPDGRSVAFIADVTGRRQLWIRLIAGGAPLQITHDNTDHQLPRWSPDSNSLIYYSPPAESGTQGTLWETSALGGAPRRLAGAIGGADISHDGTQLAFLQFSRGQVELVVSRRDGSNLRVVTRLPPGFNYQFPRWSPDDKSIAYQQGTIFQYDVMTVAAEGGAPHHLTHEGNLLNGFAWLPDGSGIVFSSARGGTLLYLPPYNLWTVRLDGSGLRQITFGEMSYVTPDVNNKGTLVASRIQRQFDIWKIPIDGTPKENARRAVRVTHQTGAVQTPTVSPDGKEVAYLSDSGGHGNVWVSNIASGDLRQITFEKEPNVALGVPVWSPDGKYITFVSTRNLENWDFGLWLVAPDGSNLRNIVEHGGWAAWSPDGKWLYYSVNRNGRYEIEKISLESGERALVRNDNGVNPTPLHDGRLYYLVSTADVNGLADYEIRVAQPENGEAKVVGRIPSARTLTESPTAHLFASPDGKWLATQLRDPEGTNVWALPTSGGSLRQITDFSPKRTVIARRVSWSPDSRSIFAAIGEGDADVVLLEGALQ